MTNDILTHKQEKFIEYGIEFAAFSYLMSRDRVPGTHTRLVHNDVEYAGVAASSTAIMLWIWPALLGGALAFYLFTPFIFIWPAMIFLEHKPHANAALGVPLCVIGFALWFKFMGIPVSKRMWGVIRQPEILPAPDYQGRIYSDAQKEKAAQYVLKALRREQERQTKAQAKARVKAARRQARVYRAYEATPPPAPTPVPKPIKSWTQPSLWD